MVCRSEKRFLIITSKVKITFLLIEGLLNQIKKLSNCEVMLCVNLQHYKWANSSPRNLYLWFTKYFTRFFYKPEHIFPDLSYTVLQYSITFALIAVRQEVGNFKSPVIVRELEFAMNLALYGLL